MLRTAKRREAFAEYESNGTEMASSPQLHGCRHPAAAAQFLTVTPSWVYEHSRLGAGEMLPFVKIGNYLQFDVPIFALTSIGNPAAYADANVDLDARPL